MTNYDVNLELVNVIKTGFSNELDAQDSLLKIKNLIDSGADPDYKKEEFYIQEPIISIAISDLNIKVVELLLSEGANPNVSDQSKHTPLHILVETSINNKSLEIANLLLEKGADINLEDKNSRNPLKLLELYEKKFSEHYPNKLAVEKLKKILINAELEVKSKEENSKRLIKAIALSQNSEEQIIDRVKELISLGADINYSNSFLNIAINHAVVKKYYNLTSKLIDWGSDVDNCINNNPAAVPFLCAIKKNKDPKMVKLLMEKIDPKRFKDRDSSFLLELALDTKFNTETEKEEMVNIINTTKYINPVITKFDTKKSAIKRLARNKRIGGFKK